MSDVVAWEAGFARGQGEIERELANLEAKLLQGQTPLGADFEAVWDANRDKLYES